MGYIKDLEHANDSVLTLKTPAYMLGGSSIGIDSKNTIWFIYSKTPPRSLSYMYADFDTVWLLKFIDPTLEDRETVFLPNKFLLSQNYPNPFNPSTTIQYDILTGIHVTLKVYDVLGREVVTLVDRFETAGYKSVTLDATGLPSGVYFYRIFMNSETKTFIDVKKMIVIK
ncbi:MAG: T9SS type A sorting domain-containing protein [Ignavibacteriales bacterium]|nr:T9SS type A sorting domain-containing protein [Ignavibacteriales bacterium]